MATHRVYTTPLPKKLGIIADIEVALVAAPPHFKETLGELPLNVAFVSRFTPSTKLGLCFVRSLDELDAILDIVASSLPTQASVWIIYPKRTGKYRVDFNENQVRDRALKTGLVDYKVCAVDNDWSALKFTRRKS